MASQSALDAFAPVKPLPHVWNTAEHVKGLKSILNGYIPCPAIIPNLKAVIHAYETNAMPSSGTLYFKNGQMVSEEEGKKRGATVWVEVRSSTLWQSRSLTLAIFSEWAISDISVEIRWDEAQMGGQR